MRRTIPLTLIRATLLIAIMIGAWPFAMPAWSEPAKGVETRSHFDIAAQPLATALRRLADTADLQLVYSPDLVAGIGTPGVKGDFTALEALEQLIKGSGLTYSFDGRNTVVVRRNQAPSARPATTETTGSNAMADGTTIEEIVVTALRREQSVLTVPMSITAFSGAYLEANHITDVGQYFAKAPNVYITGSPNRSGLVSDSALSLAIRGISDIGGTANSFGIYLDDLNINNATVNPFLVDVERVEVLKGPQSTFFGRNAEAGVISIATRKPVDGFETEASVDYSSFSTTDFKGMLNVPIVPGKVLVRFAGEIQSSDGALRNLNAIGGNDGYNNQYARLITRVLPTDRLTIDIAASYTREHQADYGLVNTGVVSAFVNSICAPPVVCPSDGPWFPQNRSNYNHDNPLLVKTSYWILSSRAVYRANGYTFTNVLGYSNLRFHRAGELDFSSFDFLREGADSRTATSFSEEMRLQSEGTGPFSWIVGAVFARDNSHKQELIQFGGQNGFGVPAGFRIEDSNPVSHIESYAAFAEASYKILPQLTLTAGGRYSRNKLRQTYHIEDDFGDPTVDNGADRTYRDFSPRLTVSYAWTADLNSYVTASKGWKAGGFQLNTGSILPVDFGAETLWNYELGTKAKLFDDRLQLSLAAFLIKWKDVQVRTSVFVNENGNVHSYSGISNGADASSRGIEFQLQARPVQALDLGFNAGYTNAHFDSFPGAVTNYGTLDLSGQPLPKAPRWTTSADVQYNLALTAGWKAFVRGEWNYASTSYTNVNGVAAANFEGLAFPFKLPSHNATNLRIGVDSNRYRIVGYVDNAFVKRGDYSAVFDFGFVDGAGVLPVERVFGIQATARF